ncbi:transposase [Streptomyces sp. 3213.3]|uniref:transposase n=1 Tax=Streptomyces sp. 3213.3 TaxID=1855348 RepID=UPI000AB1765D|nr:transposase [Streptomyces sp. 3213.3]
MDPTTWKAHALHHALRTPAQRWQYLNDEAKALTKAIVDLVHRAAPQLLEPFGIGVDTAAEILVVAGDNPERIKSEAVLAKLAGIAPVPTGSGTTGGRHRINHGGHRQLTAATYRTVIVRMRFHQRGERHVHADAGGPLPARLRAVPGT